MSSGGAEVTADGDAAACNIAGSSTFDVDWLAANADVADTMGPDGTQETLIMTEGTVGDSARGPNESETTCVGGAVPGDVDTVGSGAECPNELVTMCAGGMTLGSADAVGDGTVGGGGMTER